MKIAFLARANLYDVRGGDTIQIEATCKALQRLGFSVNILTQPTREALEEATVIHFFNLARPEEILRHWSLVKSKTLLVSTIYVDYSTTQAKHPILGKLQYLVGKHGVEYLKALARAIKGQIPWPPFFYLINGQRRSVQRILKQAHTLITSTEKEALRIQKDFDVTFNPVVIPLGVDAAYVYPETPVNRTGVLCVGRIEPLKNQLHLIAVCVKNNWPLTIVGQPAPNHRDYYEACLKAAQQNVTFIESLEPEALCKLYQQHQVHALPSFFETFNLTTLEALVCGCNAILGQHTDATEIYGDDIQYVAPNDKSALEDAISKALQHPLPKTKALHYSEQFQWDCIGKTLAKEYQRIC